MEDIRQITAPRESNNFEFVTESNKGKENLREISTEHCYQICCIELYSLHSEGVGGIVLWHFHDQSINWGLASIPSFFIDFYHFFILFCYK